MVRGSTSFGQNRIEHKILGLDFSFELIRRSKIFADKYRISRFACIYSSYHKIHYFLETKTSCKMH